MKYLITFSLLLVFVFSGSSQLSASNKKLIETRLLDRINELRKELGVGELIMQSDLKKPAVVHSGYMSENNELSHFESIPKFSTVQRRIEYFTPLTFDYFGENILLSKKVRLPLSDKRAEKIAKQMFYGWKNSPGHYANMIEKEFDSTNFGFVLSENNQIYATNVFGRLGVKIKGQLSMDGFGLVDEETDECYELSKVYSNGLLNVGNSFEIDGSEVYFSYHDKDYFSKLFSADNDGFAIDIVNADQFPCNGPNQLDISPIYDGVLLKPVYVKEILANNTAKSDFRIISKIGDIPEVLIGKNLSMVVLLLKDGAVCKKVIPNYVPRRSYPLKDLALKLDNPNGVNYVADSEIKLISIPFEFSVNKSTPVEWPVLPSQISDVISVEILSYSSIEGSEKVNSQLHNARANAIKKHIRKTLSLTNAPSKICAKENWDEFYFQLKFYNADELLNKSKQELRKIASNRSEARLPWEDMLHDQRKSIANIYYKVSTSSSNQRFDPNFSNLMYAIGMDDMPLAQKALFNIYHDTSANKQHYFDDSVFEALMNKRELVNNFAAVISRSNTIDIKQSTRFLNKWLLELNNLDESSKFSLLDLYTRFNYRLLQNWDLDSKKFANVLNPSKIDSDFSNLSSDELMLNLHLTFIKYYGQINDSRKIDESFDFISEYFSIRSLGIDDGIALCLFYNSWSMYSMTNDYLISRYDDDELNEEAIFLLIQTLVRDNDEIDLVDFSELNRKALELNKDRWCSIMNHDPQSKRDPKLKAMICEHCALGHSHE